VHALPLEHRGQTLRAHVDHGAGPDETFYRVYGAPAASGLVATYLGWLRPVGDLKAGLFVSSADPHTPRSQADHLDQLLKAAADRYREAQRHA